MRQSLDLLRESLAADSRHTGMPEANITNG